MGERPQASPEAAVLSRGQEGRGAQARGEGWPQEGRGTQVGGAGGAGVCGPLDGLREAADYQLM